MSFRAPTESETRLLAALSRAAPEVAGGQQWVHTVNVETMDDGGMGSLLLRTSEAPDTHRRLHRVASELSFTDKDGAAVIASLHVDHHDIPLEMDIWKTTFEPLISVPEVLPAARRPSI